MVEDEVFIRLDIADALRTSGLTVVEAASADDAATYVDAGEPLDALFTDVQLPGALNGLSLARRVLVRHPNVSIVVTSGNDMFRKEALGLGTFVPKPYEPLRIVRLINYLLDPTQA
ncbi:response regulator [Bradyrhizobium sp. CCBAU 51753]|uniref:response regulator n=1 Tax=Bradyrhizobium sp. CCBAU 51753 TaxID=1325100 RepID=UPI001AEE4574|nr:response regulator [Bradyrhizobium sp. CCBAU 51753]